MASSTRDARASQLASTAVASIRAGSVEDAARALKEALYLAPQHDKVQEALRIVRDHDNTPSLLDLCRSFAAAGPQHGRAGREALWLLSSGSAASLPSDAAAKCFDIVVGPAPPSAIDTEADQPAASNSSTSLLKQDPSHDQPETPSPSLSITRDHRFENSLQTVPDTPHENDNDAPVRDDLVAALVHHCPGARAHVARRLQRAIAPVFTQLFDIGDGAANAITVVSLDKKAWTSEEVRVRAEKDVFLLFLARFLESTDDLDGRALKGISRHLAVDAAQLHTEVDSESFDAILDCLDYRLPRDVRSQATLATAKYLEAAGATGEEQLRSYVTTRTAKHSSEDLVHAFSTAAAVFPLATAVVAQLFLIDGFLPSLVPMLDKKSRPIKVEKAALDMLSAACIDAGCRAAIAKYCREWMHHVMEDPTDERHGQAAVILAKLHGAPGSPTSTPPSTVASTNSSVAASEASTASDMSDDGLDARRNSSKGLTDVVPALKSMLQNTDEMNRRTAIEGLAYASIQPAVKDDLIRDVGFLKTFLTPPGKDAITPTAAFGALTLLDHLTRYRSAVSAEQQSIADLKAYANASKPDSATRQDPRDDDSAVAARCKRLVDHRVVSYLVALRNSLVTAQLTPSALSLYAQILRSLARSPPTRGPLVQQGAVTLLLSLYASPQLDASSQAAAAHALARILISVDPSLLSSHTALCVTPLVSLLDDSDEALSAQNSSGNPTSLARGPLDNNPAPRDRLPIFEALLSLTNLVSDPMLLPASSFVTLLTPPVFPKIETLLLSTHTLLIRAAAELVCNLLTTASAVALPPTASLGDADSQPLDPVDALYASAEHGSIRRLHLLLALTDSPDVATRRATSAALASLAVRPAVVLLLLSRVERGPPRILRTLQDDDSGVVHRGLVLIQEMLSHAEPVSLASTVRQTLRTDGAESILDSLLQTSSPDPKSGPKGQTKGQKEASAQDLALSPEIRGLVKDIRKELTGGST